MISLLSLYWPTILAAMLMSGALAVAGAFLLTRQAGVQSLALSQGAGLGVSSGLLLALLFFPERHLEHTALPLAAGLAAAAIVFVATGALARRSPSPVAVHLAGFALLWAASQLLIGFFPAVETHATALYFGDLVTLTRGEAFFFLALGGAGLAYFAFTWKRQAERAFEGAILEDPFRLSHPVDLGFYLSTLLLLSASVQLLGLLFTLSALFLPTTLYAFSRKTGAGRHLLRAGTAALLAGGFGFVLSLFEPRFLTTPLIGLCLAAVPALHLITERLFFRCK